MQCIITKQIKWHMGHRVPNHKSRCKSIHGHTYLLTAHVLGIVGEIAGASDEGMVMDFGDIKAVLIERIYNVLDHACMLWDKDPLVPALRADEGTRLVEVSFIPTAENIARYCFDAVKDELYMYTKNPLIQRRLLQIDINETPTSAASYADPHTSWQQRGLI